MVFVVDDLAAVPSDDLRILHWNVEPLDVIAKPMHGSLIWANPASECAFVMPGNQPLAVAQVTCPPGGKSGKNQEEEA